MKNLFVYQSFFFACILALLLSQASPVWGLFGGLLFSIFLGAPYPNELLAKFHKPMLKYAIVGLGFGMNFQNVLSVGIEGLGITLLTLVFTVSAGWFIAKLLGIEPKIAFLIASGTAICGGSAIAALSPVIDAKNREISVAMGVIFILNAVALLIFPFLGRELGLSATQFAWWSAIAIHDTSSVVGTASQFGNESLALATTIKLTRALWIVPFSLLAAHLFYTKNKKNDYPYFILFFILAALVSTYFPVIQVVSPFIVQLSKSAFTIVLFLIGIGINKTAIRETGAKPILYGVLLWLIISLISLFGVIYQFCTSLVC